LSLFCSQKAPGDPYLKILSTIYVNSEQGSAGLSELDDVSNITVYPNPTDGDLYIDLKGTEYTGIRLFDAQGKALPVTVTNIGGKLKLSTPSEVGMYILEIRTNNSAEIKRVRFMRVK
jgi:hypothetical protein